MRNLALMLLVALGSYGQTLGTAGAAGSGATPDQALPPETPQEDLCTLEGQVFNLITSEPLNKARVVLNRTDLPPVWNRVLCGR